MEDLGFKIEDRQSKFEDSYMAHQHLIHMFLFVLCRKSRYFDEDFQLFPGLQYMNDIVLDKSNVIKDFITAN